MKNTMYELFSQCVVKNGMLQFPRALSPDEVHRVYFKFTEDLLNRNIPHYRVVGFWHYPDDEHNGISAFSEHNAYGCSLIELAEKMKYIIPIDIGGNNPEKGCFYGEHEDCKNVQGFDTTFCIHSRGARSNLLTVSKDITCQLMIDVTRPPRLGVENDRANEGIHDYGCDEFNTDNIWYTQYASSEPAVYPEMLIPHKHIAELKRPKRNPVMTVMFLLKGTGERSYEDNQQLVVGDLSRYYMPCRTVYDLSKFVVCAYPTQVTNAFKLNYLENINENVLTHILQEYGRSFADEC